LNEAFLDLDCKLILYLQPVDRWTLPPGSDVQKDEPDEFGDSIAAWDLPTNASKGSGSNFKAFFALPPLEGNTWLTNTKIITLPGGAS
jgi:hypothetical protein